MASKAEFGVPATRGPRRDRTRVTFYRGVRTIGGNLIDVEYGDSHVMFDFGCAYDPGAAEQPQNLPDLVRLGLVPYLPGIFDRDIPVPGHEWHADDHAHAAVFLSHAHLDHTKMINYLDRSIPLYASNDTKAVLEAMNTHDDFDFPPYAREQGDASAPHTRPINGLPYGGVVRIGAITVTLLQVDHDAYGASGYLIDTPDRRIAYTGDIRFHGFLQDKTYAFLAAARRADMLIMEGTALSFSEPGVGEPRQEVTEEEVCERIAALVGDNAHRQITFNHYPTNLDRIRHLVHSVPRMTVLAEHEAAVYTAVTGERVYWFRGPGEPEGADEAVTLDPELEVPLDVLLGDEGSYFWQLDDATRAAHQKDLKRGGLYVHTGAAPLGPYDPSYAPFFQSFADLGIDAQRISCDGHATVEREFEIIDTVRPHVLAPVHGEHPERYRNDYGMMILPERGLVVEL